MAFDRSISMVPCLPESSATRWHLMLLALAYTRAPRDRYEGLPCRSANIPDCPRRRCERYDIRFQRRSRHSDRSGDEPGSPASSS